MREFIYRYKPSERDNVQDISQTMFYKLNEEVVKFFDEKIENELDKKFEQGAIDFKLFIFEHYYYVLLNNKKENKEYQNNYFKLMNKYLKNEINEIGYNKYFTVLLDQISNNSERQPSELNFLAFNEFIKCLNENIIRIKDIWDININHRQEKNLIKNSFEVLYNYANKIFSSIKSIYNKQNNNEIQNNINLYNNTNISNYISDINKQRIIFIDNVQKIFQFFKKFEEGGGVPTDFDNYKNFVLEKFLQFFLQIIYLFIRMKPLLTKEEAELVCQSVCFMLKNSTSSNSVDNSLNLFWELINYCTITVNEAGQNIINCIYDEIYKNWKKYFDFEIYLKNKYLSETKINKVLTFFIRFYSYIFNGSAGRNSRMFGHQILIFKNLLKSVEEDDYKIFMKLVEKINDSQVSLENKIYIILMIYDFLNWYYTQQQLIEFDIVYFILNQINIFLYTLYSLHKDDNVAMFLKEEKQIQKDYMQKNILEINNSTNNGENDINIKKNNLNGILYILTKGKFDKYIHIKDSKYFNEILKSSNNSQHSLLDIVINIIYFFKKILNKNSSEKNTKIYYLDKISNVLCKFFFYYFYVYEKFKINHQNHEQNDYISLILFKYIKELYEESNPDLFITVFKKLMPYIYTLYKLGLKLCPNKPCVLQKLFNYVFRNIKDINAREKLFKIYFEFFARKIYQMGNVIESYDNNSINNNNSGLNESINYISMLKTLNIFDNITQFDFFKNGVIPLIIDIIHLSKNSEYFGNYIYIIRCFFKNIKGTNLSIREKKKLLEDYNSEINYILYPLIKYLINLKSKAPFFNDMVSVIISNMPLKPSFINEIPELIFPSLIDNLINDLNNKELNLSNLEYWINLFYIKIPENVLPFFDKKLPEISEFLAENITRFVNKNLWFDSLKLLAKLGGRGRNFFLDKKLITKTCPLQILSMKLEEDNEKKTNKKNMDLILDHIIDFDIDSCITWRNKIMNKKIITENDKKLIINFIEIFKNCLVAFFPKKIDYKYILYVKKNIIEKNFKFNEDEFNSDFSFRQMNEKNSKIKINSIFRKKEHFYIGKIITGYILIASSFNEIENLKEDNYFKENDIMEFISDYLIMILLSKEKNNKNIFLFEQDPMYIIDELIQFLFTTHPTIIKSTNSQLSDYSIKIINYIIDTLKNFFENDVDILKNLEIVEIIYLKFLNCCYNDDANKIDIGLILLKILIDKFDKKINFKFLKYYFKAISRVMLNYHNIIKIKFKKGCNNLIELIDALINMFIINDINFFSINENDLEKNNDDIVNNFRMLFEFIKYAFDDIVDKINSENNYTRNYVIFLIEKIIGKNLYIKQMIPILFQLDINNFTIKDFLKYYKEINNIYNYRPILGNVNKKEDWAPILKNSKNKYILPIFQETKIYKQIQNILTTLTCKLGIREKAFVNLISNSNALNNIFEICPSLIKEYIEINNTKIYLDMIQALYHNILINYFNYVYAVNYIKQANEINLVRYTYLFLEKLLVEKNIEFNFEINDEQGNKILIKNEVPEEYIKHIEKYLNDNFNNFSHFNEVNNKYNIIDELFESLELKINMIQNYVQLLDNIFGKYNNFFIGKDINIFNEYKNKITKLIFLHIFNIHNAKIIKQCTNYLKNILSQDEKLKQEIFKEFNEKILKLIDNINLEEIRKSNCAFNYEIKIGLQIENINSLLIISKVLNLNDDINIKHKIIQNLKHFEIILEEKIGNSQLILSFGFISFFLYFDISDDKEIINRIFNLILNLIKSPLLYPEKNLFNLENIIYKKKIIKLITKYRKNLSRYIIEKSVNIYENKNIINLIKIIISENNSYLICETLFKDITDEFKNNITKNYSNNNKIDLIKVSHLLKICQKISKEYKIYLKSTSFIYIIEPYIKLLSKNFVENSSWSQSPNLVFIKKIFKYWIEMNIYYIKSFRDKKFYLMNLFFCRTLPNLPDIEKNKIDKFFTHSICLVNKYKSQKDFEKNYKYIMDIFISLDSDIKKYFDVFVEKLIIPMTINFYKNKNFFDKNDKISSLEEEYLICTLEKLLTNLSKLKFTKEKKEESKFKLIILLIILYQQYLSYKNKSINDSRINNIYYQIQSLLEYSPSYDKTNQLGLWRIYLFLAICIFSEQNKREQEKNLEIIFNFNRKLNEDYEDIKNLIYDLVLSNTKSESPILKIFSFTLKDNLNNIIFFFKLFLKYPHMINFIGSRFLKDILGYIYKIRETNKFLEKKKNIFVQMLGMITLYIKNKKKNNNIEQELEKLSFHITYKVYKSLLLYFKEKDPEINVAFSKLLNYLRELMDTKTILNLEIKIEDINKINYIHAHVYFMRICFFYFGFNSLMNNNDNVKFFFLLNKYIIDKKINHCVINDYIIIFRLLIDLDTFFEINQKEKPEEIYIIQYKKNLMNEIKELIKDKNNINNKFFHFDLKNYIISINTQINLLKINEIFENITKKVFEYLRLNHFYPDLNAQNRPPLQPINTTIASTESQSVNPRPQQMLQQPENISPDRWLDTFQIYEIKNFIFCRKFFDEFYNSIEKYKNINVINNNMNNIKLNELKNDLDNIIKAKKENMELIYYSTFIFFENFYYFTLYFLKEYYTLFKKNFLSGNITPKEAVDYFESTHCFFYCLKKYDKGDINKLKKENFEIIINDIENLNKKYAFNIVCIYVDIILSCFLFFFQCDEIMEQYYNLIMELFLYTYKFFKDKYYETIFIYLIEEIIIRNKVMNKKIEDKNIFIYRFLKVMEQLNSFKPLRTNEKIVDIFVNYLIELRKNLIEFDFSDKKYSIVNKILRIILYNSAKFDIEKRKKIFELIKSYIGYDIVSYLKWIFNLDEFDPNDIYSFIFFETITLSVDFLLSFFKQNVPLIMNDYNVSKFKSLTFNENNNMEIEEDEIKYDKNNYIKSMVEKCNYFTKEKKVGDLLDPIHILINYESSPYKLFIIVFTQLWKILTQAERETITVYINKFFYEYTTRQKERNNVNINFLFEAFSQCSPLIYIKPLVIQALIPYQNFWCINILYLENLLINGIDVANNYASLINIFNALKENELSNGLKYFFNENKEIKKAYAELQANNYINAENIFYDCINKINIDILNDENNLSENIFTDLSSWEEGLIECYEKSDKWKNIKELGDLSNNNEMIIKSLWFDKTEENSNLLDEYIKNTRFELNTNINISHIIQIKEIYSSIKPLIEASNNNTNFNVSSICMKCIQNIYKEYNPLFPKNMDNIDNYYFYVFQLVLESWESMNTLNDILLKIKMRKSFNFKEYLLLWRERLPHYCEGYKSLKSTLEPKNNLFKILKNVVGESMPSGGVIGVGNENIFFKLLPFYSDKVWNDMIFMRYSRKLNLIETFYEKKNAFEEENKDMIKIYPYEMYLKDIECIKLIRNNTFNYDKGINLCNECINKYKSIINEKTIDFVEYITNDFIGYKAYFNYKKGNIIDAHNLFILASVYKNKQTKNHRIYSDWAKMCEEITYAISDSEESDIWFENTIHNYIYSIIYKLDKAKFVVPRMISFIKDLENKKLKNKFNEELDELPTWIWIFWLPVLFENFNFYENNEEKNDFYFYILKKIAKEYKQIFYYSYNVYNKIILEKKSKNNNALFANDKYEELYKIVTSENKYNHIIDKINIIINEFIKKEEKNRINPLNSILTLAEKATYLKKNINTIKDFFKSLKFLLSKFDDLSNFTEDISNLLNTPDVTRNQLRDFVIKKKNYLHNLIVTENNYKQLNNLFDEKIFNIDFNEIEVPGYFSNKILEPNDQNILRISKFENQFSQKLINDSRINMLIKCTNDKLIYFILEKQNAENNIDNKIYLMQIIFNSIFEKNIDTYKRKIKFLIPIKYFLNSKLKIIEEDIFYEYNMDDIYEYCLQKRGYDPHISYQIFEEEGIKNNFDTNYLYYSEMNNQKVFEKMCAILPQDSFKNFINKFNLSGEDNLLFRKQFTTSYSLNNVMKFIFNEDIFLKNISFNKENGLCIFNNNDLNKFPENEFKEIIEQKDWITLRLTKNISYFLCFTSIYGIIPGVFYFSSKALINKSNIVKSLLKICLDNENMANNYISKFRYIINNLNENNLKNDENIGMKNIYELIENSWNDEKLKKKSIDYEAWF